MAGDDPSARAERFEALYRAHVMDVRRYCARRTTPDAAEDAVAETFTVLWRRLDEAPDEPRLWLLGVARRVIANQARGARRRLALRSRLLERPTPHAEAPTTGGTDAAIVAAVGQLPRAEREALMLVHWDDLTPSEAAVVAGCSPVAMRSRLHRARRHLLSTLNAPGVADRLQEPACERTT
jgi:RNA polymerase sigma-70 factor (ECF subfamily)